MSIFSDIRGTSESFFQIGKGGPRILRINDATFGMLNANGVYTNLFIRQLFIVENQFTFNANATGIGYDRKMIVARPMAEMIADVTYTLPPIPMDGQAFVSDAAGTISFATIPDAGGIVRTDSTTFNFNTTNGFDMFSLPVGAVVHAVSVIIDTPFDVDTNLSVGIAGNGNKYLDASMVDLTSAAETRFESHPNKAPAVGVELIKAFHTLGGATVGSARIIVEYSIPN